MKTKYTYTISRVKTILTTVNSEHKERDEYINCTGLHVLYEQTSVVDRQTDNTQGTVQTLYITENVLL